MKYKILVLKILMHMVYLLLRILAIPHGYVDSNTESECHMLRLEAEKMIEEYKSMEGD